MSAHPRPIGPGNTQLSSNDLGQVKCSTAPASNKYFSPVGSGRRPLNKCLDRFAPITNGVVGGDLLGACRRRRRAGSAKSYAQIERSLAVIRTGGLHDLIFGTGVKLPAKLAGIDANRIIVAALSFICRLS